MPRSLRRVDLTQASTAKNRTLIEPLEQRTLLSTYVVTNTNDSGAGSLRQAILNSNAHTTQTNIIDFAIGSGSKTITPATPLPIITQAVRINGFSQPGSKGSKPLIIIDGANAGSSADGLDFQDVTAGSVKGLVINQFAGVGIELETDNVTVRGNYIGTNLSGTVAEGNGTGIDVMGGQIPNNPTIIEDTIGGDTAAARNVISGNTDGVFLDGPSAEQILVEGNYIGTNAAGTAALANSIGIEAAGGSGNTIGGKNAGARNIISGNSADGIAVGFESQDNLIEGNYIGTNAAGTAAIGNGIGIDIANTFFNTIGGSTRGARNVISGNIASGIDLSNSGNNLVEGNIIGADVTGDRAIGNATGVLIQATGGLSPTSDNAIGGSTISDKNIIAFNTGDGVNIGDDLSETDAFDNPVRLNSIFSNGGQGIDFGGAGIVANTSGGPHSGPNDLQNFPVITSASSTHSTTTVLGAFNSTPSTTFVIDFYSNPTDSRQGKTYLGSETVITDSSGNATIDASLPALPLADPYLTATASVVPVSPTPDGDTSEFSAPVLTTFTFHHSFTFVS